MCFLFVHFSRSGIRRLSSVCVFFLVSVQVDSCVTDSVLRACACVVSVCMFFLDSVQIVSCVRECVQIVSCVRECVQIVSCVRECVQIVSCVREWELVAFVRKSILMYMHKCNLCIYVYACIHIYCVRVRVLSLS
jgi:hypothetical protein